MRKVMSLKDVGGVLGVECGLLWIVIKKALGNGIF